MVRRSVWRCLRKCVTRCWPPAVAVCLVRSAPRCLASSAPACLRNSAHPCLVRSASRCLLSATVPRDKSAGRRRITYITSLNSYWFWPFIYVCTGLFLRRCVSQWPRGVYLCQGNSVPVFLSRSVGQCRGRLPASSAQQQPQHPHAGQTLNLYFWTLLLLLEDFQMLSLKKFSWAVKKTALTFGRNKS